MKLFLSTRMPVEAPLEMTDVVVLPDNVLINSGKALYIPSYMVGLTMVPVVLFRITKVAKCVSEAYITRYYEREKVGFSYRAAALKDGTPEYLQYLFDGALVRSEVLTEEAQRSTLRLTHYHALEEQASQELHLPETAMAGPLISLLSHYFLLKLGDLIALPLCEETIPVVPKDAWLLSSQSGTVAEPREIIFSQVE